MGEWGRNTPWRQGHILSSDGAKALGIAHPDSSKETVVLIISHDCDLAQPPDLEPVCEAIVGHVIDKMDGNCTWGKNVRRLHLSFSDGPTKIFANFVAVDRLSIDKSALVGHMPAASVRLTTSEFTILQSWLAARYRRAAFPDQFEARLSAPHSKAREGLTALLKGADDDIVAIFFEVDGGREIDHKDKDDPYELTIYVLYSVEKDPNISAKTAAKLGKSIAELFRKFFLINGKWQNIELRHVLPLSEEGLTVRNARLMKHWYTDHFSLRTEPKPLQFAEIAG